MLFGHAASFAGESGVLSSHRRDLRPKKDEPSSESPLQINSAVVASAISCGRSTFSRLRVSGRRPRP